VPWRCTQKRAKSSRAVEPLWEVIDNMAADIDLFDWATSERRAVILRGSDLYRRQIADLRDRVLGRSRARRPDRVPPDPDRVSIRTYTTLTEVQEEVCSRVLDDTLDHDTEVDGRTRSQTTRWALNDKRVSLKKVLRDMRDDGFFKPLGKSIDE
jgi:hypothetical protein